MSRLARIAPVILSGKKAYWKKVVEYFGSSTLVGYWPLSETSGTAAQDVSGNSRNGAYIAVDLANTAAPAVTGGLAPYWDGANDAANVYSAGYAAAFGKTEGTAALWCKVAAAAAWTDGVFRNAFFTGADITNNFIQVAKSNGNNTIAVFYKANGTQEAVSATYSATGWFHFAATWSVTADEFKVFLNGAQTGTTQTALGTWSLDPASANCNIGCRSSVPSPGQVWSGFLAHCVVLNRAATPTEISKLYTGGF